MHKVYESLEDYAADIQKCIVGKNYESAYPSNEEWSGDALPVALGILANGGFDKHEARVNAIIDELRVDGLFSSGVPLPSRSYAGSRPNITAYLAGHPKQMFRRVHDEHTSINTPISIYIETTVSAGVSDYQIVNRGIALTAFVLAMQSIRPVEMYAVSSVLTHQDNLVTMCTKVCSGTIDTGRVMYALTSNAYARRVGLAMLNQFIGVHPRTSHQVPTTKENCEKVRAELGLSHEDIYIPGGHLYDSKMLNEPVAWVREKVEEHNHLE